MVPAAIETAREALLKAAGFPLARRAEIVGQAIAEQVAALAAVAPEKVKQTTEADGKVRVEIQAGGAPDWDARLRASDALEHLFGAVASRATTGGSGPTTAVQIVVELPEYAQAGPVIEPRQPDQGFPSGAPSPGGAATSAPEEDPEDF